MNSLFRYWYKKQRETRNKLASNIVYYELTYDTLVTWHILWLSFCLINLWLNTKEVAILQPTKDIQQKLQSEKYVYVDNKKTHTCGLFVIISPSHNYPACFHWKKYIYLLSHSKYIFHINSFLLASLLQQLSQAFMSRLCNDCHRTFMKTKYLSGPICMYFLVSR